MTYTAVEDGTYYVSAGEFGGAKGTYIVSVTDVTRGISVSDAEAYEGNGALVFRVSLDEVFEQTTTVRYATAEGTAVEGDDYESVSGVLEFAPGETEKRVEVVIIDDMIEDTGETFVLRLSDAVGSHLVDSEGTGMDLERRFPHDRSREVSGFVGRYRYRRPYQGRRIGDGRDLPTSFPVTS